MTTKANTMRPEELASELGINGKVLRSYLRKEFPRPAEAKNTAWVIGADAIKAARAKFAKQTTN